LTPLALLVATPALAVDHSATTGVTATNFVSSFISSAGAESRTSSYTVNPGPGGTGFAGPLNPSETAVRAAATQVAPSRFTGLDVSSAVDAVASLPDLTLRSSIIGEEEMGGQVQASIEDYLRIDNAGPAAWLRVTVSVDVPDPAFIGPYNNLYRFFAAVGDGGFGIEWLTGAGGSELPPLQLFEDGARNFLVTSSDGFDQQISWEVPILTGFNDIFLAFGTLGICQGTPLGQNCNAEYGISTQLALSRADLVGGSASGVQRFGLFEAAGVIPEPATWAMMIVGFGLVGGLARRQRGRLAAA
jgi:hypothetical protein